MSRFLLSFFVRTIKDTVQVLQYCSTTSVLKQVFSCTQHFTHNIDDVVQRPWDYRTTSHYSQPSSDLYWFCTRRCRQLSSLQDRRPHYRTKCHRSSITNQSLQAIQQKTSSGSHWHRWGRQHDEIQRRRRVHLSIRRGVGTEERHGSTNLPHWPRWSRKLCRPKTTYYSQEG